MKKQAAVLMAVVVALVVTIDAAGRAQTTPVVADVLRLAGSYVEEYEKRLSLVQSEEHYVQKELLGSSVLTFRELKSELLLVDLPGGDWLGFRDVYQVDGRAVRDQSDRLAQLFLHPAADAIAQATRIAEEGARFNIGGIARTLNTPTLGLTFLRRDNQARSSFTIEDSRSSGGVTTVVLAFKEQSSPRVIHTLDNAAAKGRFWIEMGSGRVRKSELSLESAGATARISVTYSAQPKIDLWVPTAMDEWYQSAPTRLTDNGSGPTSGTVGPRGQDARPSSPGSIEGHATYSNFKLFVVTTIAR